MNPTFAVDVAEPLMVKPDSVVVAKPTEEIENAEVEALVIASKILPVLSPHTDNFEYGVVVPTATFPPNVAKYDDPVELTTVVEA